MNALTFLHSDDVGNNGVGAFLMHSDFSRTIGARFQPEVGAFLSFLSASCLSNQYQRQIRLIFQRSAFLLSVLHIQILSFLAVYAASPFLWKVNKLPRLEPWMDKPHLLLLPTHAMTSSDTDSSR